jgi:hypothetical protein
MAIVVSSLNIYARIMHDMQLFVKGVLRYSENKRKQQNAPPAKVARQAVEKPSPQR